MTSTTLSTDSQERKDIPIQRGFLDYFPAAVAEVARLSKAGNDKHNPGEELHWARGKSMDHADCIARHQLERGIVDTDGFLHEVKVAWRAMAQLQEALEARGAPLARGARLPVEKQPTPAPAPLAWDEGWVCGGCGTTEVWHEESQGSAERDGYVLCDTADCFSRMKRAENITTRSTLPPLTIPERRRNRQAAAGLRGAQGQDILEICGDLVCGMCGKYDV